MADKKYPEAQIDNPDYLEIFDLLEGTPAPDANRFIVLGMNGTEIMTARMHQVMRDASHKFIGKTTWENRQDAEIKYSAVFAGIRLWYDREANVYLPFPPAKQEG